MFTTSLLHAGLCAGVSPGCAQAPTPLLKSASPSPRGESQVVLSMDRLVCTFHNRMQAPKEW